MAFQSTTSFATPHTFGNTTAPGPGRHAHLFQLPQSPASNLNTPSYAGATDYFSSGPRKRARPDSPHVADPRPSWGQTPSWVQCPTPGDASYTSAGPSAYGQQAMLVNERYALAGGFDTPSLEATAAMEQRQVRLGADGRRRRGDSSVGGFGLQLSGPLARERNGIARMPTSPNGGGSASWTGFAFGLVGRMFTFGTSMVQGFYAGGGQGYEMKHSPLQSNLRAILGNRQACSTPVPGAWHEDEFLGDFEQDNPHSPTTATRPPNKRRQTDKETWVMVGTPDLETSPRRKVSSTSIPRSNLATRPSASRASSRRSLAPLPRRSSSQAVYSTGSPVQPLALPTATERRASFAPIRSNSRPSSSSSAQNNTATAYISPEAEKYIKRRERQDRKADMAIGDMSRKLADLIRQGQEALGTKISVEGGSGGGGGGAGGEEMDEGPLHACLQHHIDEETSTPHTQQIWTNLRLGNLCAPRANLWATAYLPIVGGFGSERVTGKGWQRVLGGDFAPTPDKPRATVVSTPGNLIAGGLLYEGSDYDEWKARIDAVLLANGVNLTLGLGLWPGGKSLDFHSTATRLIVSSVSPKLLSRVTSIEYKSPQVLLAKLRRMARPFRLLDLPPELRVRVYEHCFPRGSVHRVDSGPTYKCTQTPALLRTCHVIRNEAHPMFYARHHFDFTYLMKTLKMRHSAKLPVVRSIRAWAGVSVKNNAKHLRQMSVQTTASRQLGLYVVTLAPGVGLTVSFPVRISEERKVEWSKHIAEVEANRKALGQQGEAVLLAFITRPYLWGDTD